MQEKYEVIRTANEYMERLINGMSECAELYRIGDMGKANQQILLIIDGIEWVIDVITLTQDVREQPLDIDANQEILHEIVEAMENQDTTLIADLLEYEMIENVKQWKNVLEKESIQ